MKRSDGLGGAIRVLKPEVRVVPTRILKIDVCRLPLVLREEHTPLALAVACLKRIHRAGGAFVHSTR